MKLVFITRKIDRGDALTGFIFTWINKLAQRIEKLYVICQEKGDASGLPDNVDIHSFGKEKGYGKLRQGFALIALSFALGKKSEGFFVHMHPIYAIIASLPAKLLGKKLVLWYAHGHVDLKLKFAALLADSILSSSPEGFRHQTKKSKFIGQAIDTKLFAPPQKRPARPTFKILSLGRISPVKHLDRFVAALEVYQEQHPDADFSATIAGAPGLAAHTYLLEQLKQQTRSAGLEGKVMFIGPVAHAETVRLYHGHDLLINLSETGSLDKAVLEAMASGSLVLTSNQAYQKLLPAYATVRSDPAAVAERIREFASTAPQTLEQYRAELRQIAADHHSLDQFVGKLLKEYQT